MPECLQPARGKRAKERGKWALQSQWPFPVSPSDESSHLPWDGKGGAFSPTPP